MEVEDIFMYYRQMVERGCVRGVDASAQEQDFARRERPENELTRKARTKTVEQRKYIELKRFLRACVKNTPRNKYK